MNYRFLGGLIFSFISTKKDSRNVRVYQLLYI